MNQPGLTEVHLQGTRVCTKVSNAAYYPDDTEQHRTAEHGRGEEMQKSEPVYQRQDSLHPVQATYPSCLCVSES